ncbi:nuclear transport factor 2 family protein [Rhodococcus opacus]|nr:nuclear transport factor 2 family protein [Rhodococcus opacus]
MSENIVRLMEENLLAVFNERDPQRRLTVVRRNYAPDVRWSDPEETVIGQDRLHERAQELLDGPLSGLNVCTIRSGLPDRRPGPAGLRHRPARSSSGRRIE